MKQKSGDIFREYFESHKHENPSIDGAMVALLNHPFDIPASEIYFQKTRRAWVESIVRIAGAAGIKLAQKPDIAADIFGAIKLQFVITAGGRRAILTDSRLSIEAPQEQPIFSESLKRRLPSKISIDSELGTKSLER
ncbi:hypothetical protein HK100_007317 [Physocladia obscura]|uniref:Uncharacterized protein n=1 Tax=Physocladia obscura TaxID=109957 RepID=A0AAD5T6J0_9FUNG|nr:hypothetical protein HK100_007317 [Physocladia obscura]